MTSRQAAAFRYYKAKAQAYDGLLAAIESLCNDSVEFYDRDGDEHFDAVLVYRLRAALCSTEPKPIVGAP